MLGATHFLCLVLIRKGNGDIPFDKVIKWWGSHLPWSQGAAPPRALSLSGPPLYFIFLFCASVSPVCPARNLTRRLLVIVGSKAAICGLSAPLARGARWDEIIYMHISRWEGREGAGREVRVKEMRMDLGREKKNMCGTARKEWGSFLIVLQFGFSNNNKHISFIGRHGTDTIILH